MEDVEDVVEGLHVVSIHCEYVVLWAIVHDCVPDGAVEEIFRHRISNHNLAWFIVLIRAASAFCRTVGMDALIAEDYVVKSLTKNIWIMVAIPHAILEV